MALTEEDLFGFPLLRLSALLSDIFSCRFALPGSVVIDRPPSRKKKPKDNFNLVPNYHASRLGPKPSMDFLQSIKDRAQSKKYEAPYPPWRRRRVLMIESLLRERRSGRSS